MQHRSKITAKAAFKCSAGIWGIKTQRCSAPLSCEPLRMSLQNADGSARFSTLCSIPWWLLSDQIASEIKQMVRVRWERWAKNCAALTPHIWGTCVCVFGFRSCVNTSSLNVWRDGIGSLSVCFWCCLAQTGGDLSEGGLAASFGSREKQTRAILTLNEICSSVIFHAAPPCVSLSFDQTIYCSFGWNLPWSSVVT